jgi:sugar O-acyltransferase (sialic acid O-acetyltransferase NeuD family)
MPQRTPSKLIIVGARSHARELHDAVVAINAQTHRWNFLGFVSDGESQLDLIARHGAPILGDLEAFDSFDPSDVAYIIGIGSPHDRKRIDTVLSAKGFTAATIVHPSAVVGSFVDLGPGCYIAAGAVLTTDISAGRHVHVNVTSSVSHDCVIGDYSIINPGSHLAGGVSFGEGVDVGVGANFLPKVSVGAWSVVGAGATVIRNVRDGVTVAGVPARKLPYKSASPV